MSRRAVNAACPVNWLCPLNRGLMGWWLCLPGWMGGSRLMNIVCPGDKDGGHATLTAMDPATDWLGPSGRPGGFGCLDFTDTDDANSDRVNVSLTRLIDAPLGAELSFGCWARSSRTDASQAAIAWGGTDDLILYPYDSVGGDGIRVFWRDLGGSIMGENGVTRTNEWHRFDVSSREGEHFTAVDGVSVATSAASLAGAGTFNSLNFGSWGDTLSQGFTGQMDDITIYNRFRPLGEVAERYRESRRWYPRALNWIRKRRARDVAAAGGRAGDLLLLGCGA